MCNGEMTVKQGHMYIDLYQHWKLQQKMVSKKLKDFSLIEYVIKKKKWQRLPRGFKAYAMEQSFLNQDSFLNSSFLNRDVSVWNQFWL